MSEKSGGELFWGQKVVKKYGIVKTLCVNELFGHIFLFEWGDWFNLGVDFKLFRLHMNILVTEIKVKPTETGIMLPNIKSELLVQKFYYLKKF